MLRAEDYRVTGTGEKADELRGEYVGQHANYFRCKAAAENTENHAFFDAIAFAGTQILTHKGGQSLREAVDGHKYKTLKLGIGTAASHSGGAEAVDIGLNKNVGYGDYAVLYTGGQTKAQDVFKTALVDGDLLNIDPIGGIHPKQMDEAQNCAHALRNRCGNGGRANAEAENGNEQKVQHDVYAGGENEVIQRVIGVADGVKNADENVIHNSENSAAEIIPEIGDGLGQNVSGRIHPA